MPEVNEKKQVAMKTGGQIRSRQVKPGQTQSNLSNGAKANQGENVLGKGVWMAELINDQNTRCFSHFETEQVHRGSGPPVVAGWHARRPARATRPERPVRAPGLQGQANG